MKTIDTRSFPNNYLHPGPMKGKKRAKFQNKWVPNTKSLLLEEIMGFVYSNFLNMFADKANKDTRPFPNDYLAPGPVKCQKRSQISK